MLKVVKPLICVTGILTALPIFGAELVTDEATRLQVLKAVFPNAVISVSHQPPLDWKPFPWPGQPLTDALEGEKEYSVIRPADEFEQTWASDLTGDSGYKNERRLRFQVYTVASRQPDRVYVALAHYKFTGIQTYAFCCEWFTRVFLATRKEGRWIVDRTTESLHVQSQDCAVIQNG